jgi:hypothetical protein
MKKMPKKSSEPDEQPESTTNGQPDQMLVLKVESNLDPKGNELHGLKKWRLKLIEKFGDKLLAKFVDLLWLLLGSALALSGNWLWSQPPHPKTEAIATFDGRPTGYPQTAHGEQFSVFLDSSHTNFQSGQSRPETSTIRYYRSAEGTDGPGFLTVNYNLRKDSASPPYAGLFADLSTPPKPYNIQGYSGVTLKIRWSGFVEEEQRKRADEGGFAVYFALADEDVPVYERYAFSEVKVIDAKDITSNWQTTKLEFPEFHPPDWLDNDKASEANRNHKLNLKKVYRFIIKLAMKKADFDLVGAIDIDEIKFYR